MATAKVLGSFNILSGSDPLKYGYGDLNLNRHLQLTGVGINHQIDNQNDATGSISVVSGGYLTAESKSGNNSILTNSANATGSIDKLNRSNRPIRCSRLPESNGRSARITRSAN